MKKYKKFLFAATLMGGTLFGFLPNCIEGEILNLVTPLLIH